MLRQKKWIAVLLAVLVLMSNMLVYADSEATTAKLIFSGVTLQDAGDSTQAFIDFKVKNIQNQGITFDFEYNTDYVGLSNKATNESIDPDTENPLSGFFVESHDAIRLNDNIFSEGAFVMSGNHTASEEEGYNLLHLDFIANPQYDAPDSEYIGTKTINTDADGTSETIRIIKASNREVTLGSISFRIKDPAAFSRLAPEEMQSVFRVRQNNTTGKSVFEISYVDMAAYPPMVFTDKDSNLEYQFDIVNPISSVTADRSGLTVSAAEIYGYAGTNSGYYGEQDLIAYLNANMQDITVKYANGTLIKSSMIWGDRSKGFSYRRTDQSSGTTGGWNRQGGVYEIEQDYNDDITVRATLTVTPVRIIGYSVDRDEITYTSEANLPATKSALELPAKARPIFDQVVPGKNKYEIGLPAADAWEQTDPVIASDGKNDFFYQNDTVPEEERVDKRGKYVFSCTIPTNDILDVVPWATVEGDQSVSVNRNFYDSGIGSPVKVEAVTDDDGVMTITVGSVTNFGTALGMDVLPEHTDFDIRMPNGEVLSKSNFPDGGAGIFDVKINQPENGKAVITLKAGDLTNEQQARLSRYINMGERLGNFAIAARNDSVPTGRSTWTSFFSNARKNIYLNEEGQAAAGTYTFDYSGSSTSFFRFEAGDTAPSDTIRLAGNDAVNTVYDGTNGLEPGALSVITVDGWTLDAAQCVSADGTAITDVSDLKAGDTAVFVGTLSALNSGDWGEVLNPNDVSVTLKATVREAADPEKPEQIADIPDFTFDSRPLGYTSDDLQIEEFTIENIGRVPIDGLRVSISKTVGTDVSMGGDSQSTNYQAFMLLSQPVYQLSEGEATTFRISTREGLPAGKYTADVTIGSDKNDVLGTFQISFTVSDKDLYEIEVKVLPDASGVGTATLAGGRYYSEGDTVELTATVKDSDYTFDGWSLDPMEGISSGAIAFAPSTSDAAVHFVLPDMSDPDINPRGLTKFTIYAVFNAGEKAGMRLQDLTLLNPDDSINPLLDDKYKGKPFDPAVLDYVALAEADVETNKAQFHYQVTTYPGETVSVSAILTEIEGEGDSEISTPQAITVSAIADDATGYETDPLPLAKAPHRNVLTLTITKTTDPGDGSDPTVLEKTYTVTIYRKRAVDEMIQLDYGNSPYGLIMRDTAVADDQKQLWKDKFDEGDSATTESAFNCFQKDYTPEDGKTGLLYRADAWGDPADADYKNYDKDDKALFVYSGTAFSDPGILGLTDSLGRPINITTNPGKVKRQFKVNALSALPKANLISDFTSVTAKTISFTGTGPVNDLTTLRVRPDVYKIEYTFEDFDGTLVTAERPLIVLPKRGDVNVSGAADENDTKLLASRARVKLPYTIRGYETGGTLYKYRVCDANTDRNINIADKRYIEQHYGRMIEFY